MKKIVSFNSAGIKYIKKMDYEVVNVSSEKNSLYNFKSSTFKYASEYEEWLVSLLKSKYKEPIYKILFIADEDKSGKLKNIKLITYLESKEIIDFVKNSLTQKHNSEYEILTGLPKDKEMTFFEQHCQLWSDQIQRYLSNYYNFDGITKIVACGLNYGKKIGSFNIAVSGKGINDEIYTSLKNLESKVCNGLIKFYSTEDEIFTILKNLFDLKR